MTFRLYGSLPVGREFPVQSMTSGQAFLAMDRLLDTSRFGPIHLRRPEIARLVRDSILHCARVDFDLHAWVIMPNHVHLLVAPRTNQLLKQSGQPFWQDESHDHVVREFRSIERYILNNPVDAGLVHAVEAFPWSGAASGK